MSNLRLLWWYSLVESIFAALFLSVVIFAHIQKSYTITFLFSCFLFRSICSIIWMMIEYKVIEMREEWEKLAEKKDSGKIRSGKY